MHTDIEREYLLEAALIEAEREDEYRQHLETGRIPIKPAKIVLEIKKQEDESRINTIPF